MAGMRFIGHARDPSAGGRGRNVELPIGLFKSLDQEPGD